VLLDPQTLKDIVLLKNERILDQSAEELGICEMLGQVLDSEKFKDYDLPMPQSVVLALGQIRAIGLPLKFFMFILPPRMKRLLLEVLFVCIFQD